jgi:hypothetical protein
MKALNLEFVFGCLITVYALLAPALMYKTIQDINELDKKKTSLYESEKAESEVNFIME